MTNISCMCDHGAESQDDRRVEMRVRCKQPSAGALGISAARHFSGASASGVDPASRSSPAFQNPLMMVDSLTLLHAVRIHWQT